MVRDVTDHARSICTMRAANERLPMTRAALREMKREMKRDAMCDVRCAMCDVRCAMCDVRCAMCDVLRDMARACFARVSSEQ